MNGVRRGVYGRSTIGDGASLPFLDTDGQGVLTSEMEFEPDRGVFPGFLTRRVVFVTEGVPGSTTRVVTGRMSSTSHRLLTTLVAYLFTFKFPC